MAAKFLAIDLGASSGRAVLATLSQNKLQIQELHRFTNQPIQLLDHLHWNIFSLYEEIKIALSKCAKECTTELLGMGIDTWGVDFGFVTRNNLIAGLPYAYRDSRTNGMIEKACQKMSRKQIYAQTGIQFMPFNSIFQLLAYVSEQSPLLASAQQLLFMPDLLNFLFCGEKVNEYSIASTSQLYDPLQKKWADALFEGLNLPRELMAPIVPTGTVLGNLIPGVAEETGMAALKVIATASHDTAAAVAAVPAQGSDWAYLSSGTWSLMGIEIDEPIINEKSLAFNFTNEGGVAGSIRFLKNIAGLWLVQECRRIWQRDGEDYDFATLTQMASEARPFIGVIDPDDARFLLPENMPQAIQEYLQETGQVVPQSKGEIIRVILESLALKYRYTLEQINTLRGKPVLLLHIVGGGTQNSLLNQFAADACGIPVIAGPTEATAIGNVMVQAVTRKVLDSIQDARAVIRQSFELREYQPQNRDQWDAQFGKFKDLLG